MAEAVLEVALENLGSLIQKELGLFLVVDQEMKRLSSTLTTIQAVLEDAEEKQLTDRAIKNWLQKLKDAAHVLDDILDECATEALRLEYQGMKSGLPNKVRSSYFSSISPKHVLFRHKIAKKMKRISETLDEIAEERRKFHLLETVIDRRAKVMEWRQTSSIMTQPQVYGREEDKEKVVDFLVGHATNFENVSVYPVVGMGGLGKTTLAQLIFKNERVVKHFELRIWVCVSEDFSLKRMSKAIIEAASGHACEDLDLEPLQKRLQELVERKRYLLVLDDVWNDNQEKWDRLKQVLACGSKGASILVTTRLKKVASIMGTIPSHELSILSEDDCWTLFKHRAFGPDNREREELVAIGKEIVKKCGGVPLAAKALGSLLRFTSDEREWLNVKESKLWSLPQEENSIMPALRLSYLNLPIKLRQCFAYCAIFPKDHEISKHFLIELWMANGFISSNEKLEVEDIGEQAWNELYWRSFFQDIKSNEFGDKSFKMHDLVHDLAQSVTEEALCCISDDNGSNNLFERTRHLSIYNYKLYKQCDLLQWPQVKSLKTYLSPYGCCNKSYLLRRYSLRLLECTRFRELPSSISQLKHLRYLNLSSGYFKTLPKSICSLWNLQVLKLEYCEQLQRLPNNLTCLRALRHLYLRGCTALSSLPSHMGQLTLLRTLNKYFVDKKSGFLLEELGHLNLKGELHIKHLERISSVTEAKKANMVGKHLNDLRLSWNRNGESELQENVEQILEVLEPHTQHLEALRMGGYRGIHFPKWMGSATLENLDFLELVDCINCVQLPPLWKLPSLKRLAASNVNHVRYVDDESYSGGVVRCFKALEFLILDKLPNLEMLSKEEGEVVFPSLSKLQISECLKLALPRLPSVSELRIVEKCNHELLGSIHNLQSLESLRFNLVKELTSFPDGMLRSPTSLKILEIYRCNKFRVLPTEFINLNALEELYITYCDCLEPIAEQVWQRFHSLKILQIGWCQKFKVSVGLQYLTALEDLKLAGCPEVEGFSEALQHLTALKSLTLLDLPILASLPDCFGNLKDLQSLHISECPKLISLPISIKGVGSLKSMKIYSCPELKKRCEKEIGEDWHKIAHVPCIVMQDGCRFRSGSAGHHNIINGDGV